MAAALRALTAYQDIGDGASAGSSGGLASSHEGQARFLQQEAPSSVVSMPIDTGTDAATTGTLDLRIAAIFVIFAGAMIFGSIPIFLKYFERQDALFARLLRIFSGGVILALALVHIIPDAISDVGSLVDYPLGGIAILVGIMLLVVIDNSLAAFFTPKDAIGQVRQGHSHGHSRGPSAHSSHGSHADVHQHVSHVHSREELLKGAAADGAHAHSHDVLLKGAAVDVLASAHSPGRNTSREGSLGGHAHIHTDPHRQRLDLYQQQLEQERLLQQQQQRQRRQAGEEQQGAHCIALDDDAEAAAAKAVMAGDVASTVHHRRTSQASYGHHVHADADAEPHLHDHEVVDVPGAHEHPHGEDAHTHQCMRSMNAQHWVSSVVSGGVADVRQYVTAYTMEMGCIFHSIMIGIGMGVIVTDRRLVATLMIALTVHQGLEGISLASVLTLTPFSRVKRMLMLLMYSITTPLGIAVGIAISSTYDPDTNVAKGVQGMLNGVSGGMLLYIAMYQLIGEELSREDLLVRTGLRLAMYGTLMLGSALMCTIAIWA